MPTLTISPKSEDDSKSLDYLASEQRRFYAEMNERRWNDFDDRDKIFEKTLDDAPDTDLPTNTEYILLRANAQDWATHILEAVKTAHIARMKASDIIATKNIWYDKTTIAEPIGNFPKLCIAADDLDYCSDSIRLSNGDNSIVFDVESGIENITNLGDLPLYLYEAGDSLILEPYEITTEPENQLKRNEKPQSKDFKSVLRTLSVAASVSTVAQVEPRADNEVFPKLFEEVGLFYVQVETDDDLLDTYLVGTKKRGKERITEFINTDYDDRTIEQYCHLLGYPEETGEYYCDSSWQEKQYDRYSAEEFGLYGLMKGEITEPELRYLLYAPYRPAPTIKSVKFAIQFAQQFQEGLNIIYNEAPSEEDYNQLMDYYDKHNDKNKLIRDKPILEVYNWLVECRTENINKPVQI